MIIKNLIKFIVNGFLKLFNLQLNKITLSNNFYYHIVKTLEFYDIDLVIDIGANEGQFAKKIIEYGYKNEIISFEPMKSAFIELEKNSKKLTQWKTVNLGFGKENSFEFLNISKNSVSSSILQVLKTSTDVEPDTKFISKEKIELITLNQYLSNNEYKDKNIFVKIDTQGFEKNIILGAEKVKDKIKGFLVELSIVKLYSSTEPFSEMIDFLNKLGFELWSIERGFSNKKTGQTLQVDAIFINKNKIC